MTKEFFNKPSQQATSGSLIDKLLKRTQRSRQTRMPYVSVVCPTFNRREFLPCLIYMFHYQDYPADRRELVILDDSPVSNQDLVDMMADYTQYRVRYIHSPTRLPLGKKRNMLNSMAVGEYIICFDDDDYYPPEKISYQVAEMQRNNALFSGCDQIYVWYSHLDKIFLTCPFGPTHALNGTFGIHRNLLRKTRYDNDARLAEEQSFLKGFTLPVLQVDPRKAILCISHSSNTYDKDFIMGSSVPVDLTLEDFIQDRFLLSRYRRLSKAPSGTRIDWSGFDKIALLYEPGQFALLAGQRETLLQLGVKPEQLWLVEKSKEQTAAMAELKTHCAVLEQAQHKNWNNIVLLDVALSFVRKELMIEKVNLLFKQLPHTVWQVLILGGRYNQLHPLKSIDGVARIIDGGCGCAYAVNSHFIPVMLAAYRQALAESASLDLTWPAMMANHCWLGFSPGFAFLQQVSDPVTGKPVDCTHWFFRKHSKTDKQPVSILE